MLAKQGTVSPRELFSLTAHTRATVLQVNDRQLQILCPDVDDDTDVGCSEALTPEIMLELLSAENRERYLKFQEMDADPNMRECALRTCSPANQLPTGPQRHPAIAVAK